MALFRSSQNVETTNSPSTGDWINKISYIHIMDYYSTNYWLDTYNIDEPQKYYVK